VDILRFLAKTGAEWNGREIARELKISPAACHKALKGLYQEGVLSLKAIGRTHLYKLNQGHLMVQNLLAPLFKHEIKGVDILVHLINQKIKGYGSGYFVSLALFGSILTGKEKPDSDIDLLVIIKRSADRQKSEVFMDELGKFLAIKTGNTLSPYLQTAEEFRLKYKKKVKIVNAIANSHLLIRGKPVKDLL
jgi:predicted nucleotidyltransferase/biotin operon repressor